MSNLIVTGNFTLSLLLVITLNINHKKKWAWAMEGLRFRALREVGFELIGPSTWTSLRRVFWVYWAKKNWIWVIWLKRMKLFPFCNSNLFFFNPKNYPFLHKNILIFFLQQNFFFRTHVNNRYIEGHLCQKQVCFQDKKYGG